MRMLALALLVASGLAGQDVMTPELLWKLKRVGGGSISPDGTTVLYSVRSVDLAENKGDSDLWLVPIGGGEPKRLTSGPLSEADAQWVATPAGPRVFVVAKKGEAPQVFSIDPESKAWTQVTDVAGGVANLKVSPTGRHLAFTIDVKIDPTVQDLYPDLPKADAKIIDSLLYRHWDHWEDGLFSHLHLAALGEDGKAGKEVDVMAGLRTDCPLPPFGGTEAYAWSPDGTTIAWTMKLVNDPEASTDSDLYVRPVDAEGRAQCLSSGQDGYDLAPVWSPDGRRLAWLSMERPGFEADRQRIMIHEFEEDRTFEATAGLALNAHDLRFAPDGRSLYFRSEARGTEQIYRLTLGESEPLVTPVTQGRFNWALTDITPDGKRLVLSRQDMLRPPELFVADANGGGLERLTKVNDAAYEGLALPTVEERWVRATDGARVHCWVLKPPAFDTATKYPMLTYCQGGPQSQIGQSFSNRWNFHLMAAKGYVVLAPNRRGLPGFGQAWNDAISGDWGGQAMQDLLAATDDLLTEPWIDQKRVAAVGASFGGYSVYWLMGNAGDRFCAMIAHCGVFNLESMYGSTEELFFVNWDLGGPYWQSDGQRAIYEAFSPHRFVGRWKTPLLVIHGEKDFRVPVTQGMEAFTAAKTSGVPSRFLYFPNEGHWVNSPQNSVLWQRVFFDWLERHGRR